MRLLRTLLPAVLLGALLVPQALRAEAALNEARPGQEMDLSSALSRGRINVVDFYSKYCPPCMRISPLLEQLGRQRPDLRIVKLDINRPEVTGIDWRSPLDRQFRLQSIPHFKIYNGNGELQKEGDPAYQEVMGWLREAKLGN
jgi:thiol-disulfide isomerase/thioredoxin